MNTIHLRLLGLTALALCLGGCANQTADTATRKGHYVILEPETGTLISRRVWVSDEGTTNGSPSMSNLQSGNADAMRVIQSRGVGRGPGGN